jgi:hypothetical protein
MSIQSHKSYELVVAADDNMSALPQILINRLKGSELRHMIIDFSDVTQLSMTQINGFVGLTNGFAAAKKSLVMVVPQLNLTELENTISMAPTLLEAEDVIQMEEMARDLGF